MLDFSLLAILILLISKIFNRLHTPINIRFWLIILIFWLLYAFRGPRIGNDTEQYIEIFNETFTEGKFEYGMSRYEIGYLYLNYILKAITKDSQIIFIVTGAFIYFSFGRFIIKYSKIPWLSLYIFFTYGFFTSTFTITRQAVAMAICLFAFESILNNKNVLAILLILFASLFHNTAIVFFSAFLCKVLKPNGQLFLKGYGLALILLVVFSTVLSYVFEMLPMYEHYSSKSYIGETGVAAFIYASISSGILFFSYSRFCSEDGHLLNIPKIESYGLIMVMLAVILYIVSIKANIFDRMALYFNVFSIIVLPNAVSRLQSLKRKLNLFFIIVFFYLYSASIIELRPEWNSVFPYSFCWD